VLRATMPPLSLRLWRVPTSADAVTLRRTGARRVGIVVRRGAQERALAGAAVRLNGRQGTLLVLLIGGGGGTRDVRLTLTATH
jgi:hypothetical protein